MDKLSKLRDILQAYYDGLYTSRDVIYRADDLDDTRIDRVIERWEHDVMNDQQAVAALTELARNEDA